MLLWIALAHAAPAKPALPATPSVLTPAFLREAGPWRDDTRWMVELVPGARLPNTLLQSAPRFPGRAELSHFRVIAGRGPAPTGEGIVRSWRPFLAVPPPDSGDTGAETPDFRSEQLWLDAEYGIAASEGARFPGGDAAAITIADIEYGWELGHEDLEASADAAAWGYNTGDYAYHGTSVLGQLRATRNGAGVDGAVAAGDILVISPFASAASYDVAAAILGAVDLLSPGDVLLIEQQAYAMGDYCPVEVDPGVFTAIKTATRHGIVVVEPGGNGAQDLDAAMWDGWFDRASQDSGAVIVGGGASPFARMDTRSWYSSGSSYGARVDVQGWYDSIVTTTNGDYEGALADLYFPDQDPLRAYTESFGGTSGASPMITAVAAIAQGVHVARTGEPWEAADLRAALVSTGMPQPPDEAQHIGPMPTLRTFLRMYGRP